MPRFGQPGKKRVNWFTASYDSDCPTCFGPIYEGDQAAYLPDDDKASCEECVDEFLEE